MVSLHKAVAAFLLQFLIVRHQHPLKACQCSKNVSKLARNSVKEQEINLNAHYFYRTLKTQDNIYIKDVQSFHILFPSTPFDLVLKVLREVLEKRESLVLENNYFEFNGNVEHQISGTTIGSPTYACIFMDRGKNKFLETD